MHTEMINVYTYIYMHIYIYTLIQTLPLYVTEHMYSYRRAMSVERLLVSVPAQQIASFIHEVVVFVSYLPWWHLWGYLSAGGIFSPKWDYFVKKRQPRIAGAFADAFADPQPDFYSKADLLEDAFTDAFAILKKKTCPGGVWEYAGHTAAERNAEESGKN